MNFTQFLNCSVILLDRLEDAQLIFLIFHIFVCKPGWVDKRLDAVREKKFTDKCMGNEMLVASCVIMAFCSFASFVGGTCGPSPGNPNVVHFVGSKNSDRDVKARLKLCNILTNVKSVNSERNRLLAHAGK